MDINFKLSLPGGRQELLSFQLSEGGLSESS